LIHLVPLNPSVTVHVTHNKHNTNLHAPGGIHTHNPRKRAAADPHIRPRGHWDRQILTPNLPTPSLVTAPTTVSRLPISFRWKLIPTVVFRTLLMLKCSHM
jgi:hypothetical protein